VYTPGVFAKSAEVIEVEDVTAAWKSTQNGRVGNRLKLLGLFPATLHRKLGQRKKKFPIWESVDKTTEHPLATYSKEKERHDAALSEPILSNN
jgi:hypothetical protein